jgi:hypothetical protein
LRYFDGEVMYRSLETAQVQARHIATCTHCSGHDTRQREENRRVDHSKMACDLVDIFETSLQTLLEVTAKSGNLK